MPLQRPDRIPVELIVPHPDNANEVPKRTMERIKRSIAEKGRYPRLIVRSLEDSVEFAELHQEGKFQSMDGAHRRIILMELGHKEVDVDVWGGVTDAQALIYIAALNDHGEPNPTKRVSLIQKIMQATGEDADQVSLYIEETADDLKRFGGLSDTERKLVTFTAGDGSGKKREQDGAFCFQVFLPNRKMEKSLRGRLDAWLQQNDPDRKLSYRDAVALAALLGIGV